MDTIRFGIKRNRDNYQDTYKDTDFVLYATYSREEVCRFLHWQKEPNFQNVGGYFYDKTTNTFPVFINYKKDPSLSITTQYEDRFTSDSRARRHLEEQEDSLIPRDCETERCKEQRHPLLSVRAKR